MHYNTDVPSFCPDFSEFPNYNSVSGQALDDDERRLEERGRGKGRSVSPACLLSHNSNNPFYEVGESIVHLYKKDVVVKKFCILPSNCGINSSKRQNIFEFSDSSKQNLLRVCRNSGHHIKSQVCLTFHNSCPVNGKAFKELFNIFLTRLRKKYPDLYYLWVLEFQTKGESPGQPHVHFYSDIEPTKETRENIAKIWVHVISGSESNYKFTSHKKNFFTWNMQSGSYLAKEYIAKSIQKDVPEHYHSVGRFWGHSRNMKPSYVVLDSSLAHVKAIYTKAVRGVLRVYERVVASYMASQVVDKTLFPPKLLSGSLSEKKAVRFKHKMEVNRLLSSVRNLNFRAGQRSRVLPNVASSFITLIKHYWFYGVGATGSDHVPFDPLRCPSFEYGVSF